MRDLISGRPPGKKYPIDTQKLSVIENPIIREEAEKFANVLDPLEAKMFMLLIDVLVTDMRHRAAVETSGFLRDAMALLDKMKDLNNSSMTKAQGRAPTLSDFLPSKAK